MPTHMEQELINHEQANHPLEINSDLGTQRYLLQEMVKALRGPDKKPSSRAVALAITKMQEAAYWLGEALFGGE